MQWKQTSWDGFGFFSFHINYTGRAYNFWEIHIKEGWPRLMCVQCKVPRVDHYRDNFSIFVFFSGNEMNGISISMGRKNRNKMLEYDIWNAHFVRHLEFTVVTKKLMKWVVWDSTESVCLVFLPLVTCWSKFLIIHCIRFFGLRLTQEVAFVYVVIFCLQSRRITQENRSWVRA